MPYYFTSATFVIPLRPAAEASQPHLADSPCDGDDDVPVGVLSHASHELHATQDTATTRVTPLQASCERNRNDEGVAVSGGSLRQYNSYALPTTRWRG